MDLQSLATASLLVPTVVLGVVAWRARRQGRTLFGLGGRGALAELGVGVGWGLVASLALVGGAFALGLVEPAGWTGVWWISLGQAVGLLILFVVEEIAFRGVLLTGLGVLVGVVPAVALTSVLVALPYSFSPSASVLAVVGAVVANLVNAVARWRTGRIWFGLGLRWVLNSLFFAFGFHDAGEQLAEPALRQTVSGAAWVSGGDFGLEAGLFGIAVELLLVVAIWRRARGRRGPWRVEATRNSPHLSRT